ncbi:MAG: CotH kinase family protein [Lachnospiraceae bacterium]|nr:CotH kinase family protein [Lachnospiraceae bacterium]
MKQKRGKSFIIIALIICLLLTWNCRFVSAADVATPVALWIAPTETNGIPVRIDAFPVRTGRSSTGPTYIYQLYLPGNVDVANCFLSWDGGMQATIDGQTYDSGACPIPSANTQITYTFSNGDQASVSIPVVTYQGSPNVQSVFIDIDETEGKPTIAQMDGDEEHEITCSGWIYIEGKKQELTKIKGRGNATWRHADDKRPYNITLGKKINFPGIDSAKTKKWTLQAEALDHSLLCNRIGFYLANEMGVGLDTASADVWMNGEYQGCYTVTPKTDTFVTDDGYMIENDNYLEKPVAEGGDPQFFLEGMKEDSGHISSYNRITVKKIGDNLLMKDGEVDESPENMEAVATEIQDWLQDAWDAIRSDTGYNAKGKYYTDYIDIESFAKMYLLQEYVKSYDVCAGSLLFHRDGQTDDDKLIAGPLWDLDNALGSVMQNRALGMADDQRNGDRRSGEGYFIPYIKEYKTSIFKTLSKYEDFMEEVYAQYNKYRSVFDDLSDELEGMIREIDASARMNHIKVTDLRLNTHKYQYDTTLGSDPYLQNYLATTNSQSDWANYAANLKTYVTTRSLWFHNTYFDLYYAGYTSFRDVKDPSAWYFDTVNTIAGTVNHNGIALMGGYADGKHNFGPADPLTRQDFAVILYRLADEPEIPEVDNPFTDTQEDGYYYPSVVWAKANNVIAGYEDGRFGVGDQITREQVATILYRFAKDYLKIDTSEALAEGDLSKFKDGKAVSSWAEEALTWATGAGVISGKDNGTRVDARGNAARAEIAAMILRFMEYMDQ